MGQQLDGFYCGPAYIEYVVRIHEVPCKIGFDINIRYLSYFLRYLGKVLENSLHHNIYFISTWQNWED